MAWYRYDDYRGGGSRYGDRYDRYDDRDRGYDRYEERGGYDRYYDDRRGKTAPVHLCLLSCVHITCTLQALCLQSSILQLRCHDELWTKCVVLLFIILLKKGWVPCILTQAVQCLPPDVCALVADRVTCSLQAVAIESHDIPDPVQCFVAVFKHLCRTHWQACS